MSRHAWFIFAAYGFTTVITAALILFTVLTHWRLRDRLRHYPPRDESDTF